MRRRAILAMLLAVALVVGAVSPIGVATVQAEETTVAMAGQTNVALGKSVETSSSYVGSGWRAELAVDGKTTGINTASGEKGWTSTPVASNPTPQWMIVDLASASKINKVVLWPRNEEGTHIGTGFPVDFNIQVSSDKTNWTTVSNQVNYPNPASGGAQSFSFNAVSARYIKVEGTVLSKDDFQAYVMQLAEVEVYEVPVVQDNLALNKAVEASTSYIGSGWRPELAVDGIKVGSNTPTGDKGWTSQPVSTMPASEWIMIDLGYVDSTDKVVLWPRNDGGTNVGSGFPIDFTVKTSTDKVNWTTVATKTNYAAPTQGGAQSIALTSSYARYVKVEATKLSKDDFQKFVMQFAEIEVLQAISQLTDQEAVNVGHQWLTLSGTTNIYTNMNLPTFSLENTQVTWASSYPAYLRGDGKVMKRPAWNEGSLTVTLTATVKRGAASKTKEFPVTLKPYPNVAPEAPNTFKVAAFWPPTKDYVNAQQYDYLQEANVNFIEVVETGDLTSVEINDRMLDLAGERGMKVSVTNSEDLSSVSDHEVEEFVNHFKPHPATGGYFIRDEPVALKDFHDSARLYKKVKEMDPARLAHLNLLPGSDHWATWTGLVGASNIEYLTFDSYPFGINGMGQDFYYLLDRIRKIGLKNNYKTAGYLQSVGIDNRLIRPTPEIIRYEVYLNLAYGLKKLTWFTWWTPTGRGEPFTNAIITADGQKTDLFEPVKAMNKVMLKLGTTLLNLDAKDVYHYGQIPENTEQLPSSFYFQPVSAPNAGDDMVVTNFVHKDTGRRYVMVVNKSMTTSKNFTFAINSNTGINTVTEVSKETGAEVATNFNPATSQLSASFLPGEGRLYAMPETFIRYYPVQAEVSLLNNPTPDNLAFGKKAFGSSDTGVEWGWNAPFAIDGKRNSTPASYGWSNSLDLGVNHTEWITIDLGSTQEVGAVSLFPRADQGSAGTGFPVDYNIQVSNDNVNWTTVHSTQDYTEKPATRRNITFPAVNARYVKVEATELGKDNYNYFRIQLAEVEVYKDSSAFTNLRAKQLPSDLYVGSQSALSLGRLQPDGSLQAISGQATFSSSNPSVATVNAQGVVTGVAAGTATIAVTVPGVSGGTETKNFPVAVRQSAAPWSVAYIGGADGKVDLQPNGSYRIGASGSGIQQASEQFVYVNKTVSNSTPITLTSQIQSLRYAGSGAAGLNGKTGIMIRSASTTPQPASVLLSVNAEGRTELSYRNASGTITTIAGDYVNLPVELKLEKQGNTVTGYYKKGTAWVPIKTNAAQSSVTVSFTGTLTGGIASYSSVAGAFNDAIASIS
ncbi:Ig-like domain (group 2) [Paenibacillaceae bacterium GAS479]|nr:Ig-like domain (group 2) [Paenibacillaceae bacterium GAS479]